MLDNAKRFSEMGFSIIWLKPKSKMPIESQWTKRETKPFSALKNSYQRGFNMGVRLGKHSKVESGYLAVIDCDVKSGQPAHRVELETKIKELFGATLIETPFVKSGRGNGSGHYYVLTSTPATPRKLAQSSSRVSVLIPSVKPSKNDIEKLSKADIEKGFRLRNAWEISVLGEGNQVVMPPSIHPDTGIKYKWEIEHDPSFGFPLVEIGAGEKKKTEGNELKTFEVVEDAFNIDPTAYRMIKEGEGVEDESAALFTVAIKMVRQGLSDNQILTVLTDRDNFLGNTAYRHAQTDSRQKAAAWLFKYTLMKVRFELDAVRDFENAIEIAPLKSLDVVNTQKKEVKETGAWQDKLKRTALESGGNIKNMFYNAKVILENALERNPFQRSNFTGKETYVFDTPWAGKAKAEIDDADTINIKNWVIKHYGVEFANTNIIEAISYLARKNSYHEVINYLEGLDKWDGIPRIDTWLRDLFKAKAPEPYLSEVSRKVLCALVKRVYQPACKFDYVLVIEGKQGIGKSTMLRYLASDTWFSDAQLDVSDKDAVLALRGIWLLEMGELSGMRKADVDILKRFISCPSDRIRVPYGRKPENFLRQSVFIGTTNDSEYLKDPTGNRRFWPIEVFECDFKGMIAIRDQLFAEAKFVLENYDEKLFLDEPNSAVQATAQQNSKLESDSWEEMFARFFEIENEKVDSTFPVNKFTMHDLFSDFGILQGVKDDMQNQRRAGAILRRLGYEKRLIREGGRQHMVWHKATDKNFK